MIAIENIKLLEDITEELESLENKKESLLVGLQPKFSTLLKELFDRMHELLNNKGLQIEELNEKYSKGFVAKYKNAVIRVENDSITNRLNVFYNGEIVGSYTATVKPGKSYNDKREWVHDDLADDITVTLQSIYKTKNLILGLVNENICFVEASNKEMYLEDSEAVIKQLFRY